MSEKKSSSKIIRLIFVSRNGEKKASYTASLVACWWAGAIITQYLVRGIVVMQKKNACKWQKVRWTNKLTDWWSARLTDWWTDRPGYRVSCMGLKKGWRLTTTVRLLRRVDRSDRSGLMCYQELRALSLFRWPLGGNKLLSPPWPLWRKSFKPMDYLVVYLAYLMRWLE